MKKVVKVVMVEKRTTGRGPVSLQLAFYNDGTIGWRVTANGMMTLFGTDEQWARRFYANTEE